MNLRKYEAVIGLEIHIELKTNSKMFCQCSAEYFGARPNSHTCPICLGLPGALPKANVESIKLVQKLGLALNCNIQLSNKFDRKNYFYPDLAKGFQISQYDQPLTSNGFIYIKNQVEQPKKINITRAHLEEDTGKLTHATINNRSVTLIDFNRSGVPLVEIVSEPDMHSSDEARDYAQKLQQIVRYLGISDADMEKGSMRIEPNVSLRNAGDKILPLYKIELKNINSFKFAQAAIEYEIERQTIILDSGKIPQQETRGWNEVKKQTVSQRSKELAHDYRYFPEPDLVPMQFDKTFISKLKTKIPELPAEKIKRFQKQYELSAYDVDIITNDVDIANFFEQANIAYKKNNPKKIANWIIGELLRRLAQSNQKISQLDILPASLAELLYLIDSGEITNSSAKEIFNQMIKTGNTPKNLLKLMKIKSISPDELDLLVSKVLLANQQAVKDYKAGKTASIGFLIGQLHKKTQGQASPHLAKELILKKLNK
ncbi:glutaminyl-tRNA synthase (glutamine-hydrolyzing) subunit B [Candidatus Curtissbacteria bacterium RIFCSPHIGHO2_12_FULL_38_9b]|uniref:Aspartyl/glutamyl-tRNA(Asn/Gln) amidotransferase subunit B n=1 Tax=Candidatus Curtissbacteria bacterium RIFCSPHIGHO2_12_FULL_38_9b TaxID=1797720 RepID=A0A1F5GSS3_9BACT|nr:MAG: glutaminyl-tRNA synthase (glutamine-hydrolyzing) subunit B [Candidatus Curtissbacteria bacterium RIFCSPHIGHO2_12_FULL_38_9b]